MARTPPIYKLRVFTSLDVMQKLKMTHNAVVIALANWQEQGIIKMMRQNLYAVINPATKTPVADKYELASGISESSYIGWHTALEFYGITHLPIKNAFVGNSRHFKSFHFEDTFYEYCPPPIKSSRKSGVMSPTGNPRIRVTDLERTIADCCDRIDRAGGLEELLRCMKSIKRINEDKLTQYLALYNKTFLYQKVGFIMEHCREHNHVSDDFIETCRSKGANYARRLTNDDDSNKYVSRWKLYIPENI